MDSVTYLFQNTVQEYQNLLNDVKVYGLGTRHLNWNNIINKLQTGAGWTEEGADHIAALARNCGSFILRNALAVAIALDIEDGKLGL